MNNELLEQVKAVAHQINVGVTWKDLEIESQAEEWDAVSYTHLTLPTICSV